MAWRIHLFSISIWPSVSFDKQNPSHMYVFSFSWLILISTGKKISNSYALLKFMFTALITTKRLKTCWICQNWSLTGELETFYLLLGFNYSTQVIVLIGTIQLMTREITFATLQTLKYLFLSCRQTVANRLNILTTSKILFWRVQLGLITTIARCLIVGKQSKHNCSDILEEWGSHF